jgi:hypothetical protein
MDTFKFMLAGNAIFTLTSKATGTRFTYKVRAKDNVWFVSVLSGPDNWTNYVFLGTIHNDLTFMHGKRSTISMRAPSARAWMWFWGRFRNEGKVPEQCTVHHEGKCGRCGRKLTVPESIELGLGPECAGI